MRRAYLLAVFSLIVAAPALVRLEEAKSEPSSTASGPGLVSRALGVSCATCRAQGAEIVGVRTIIACETSRALRVGDVGDVVTGKGVFVPGRQS